MKWVLVSIFLLALVSGIIAFGYILNFKRTATEIPVPENQIVVGLLMASNSSERWTKDRDFFISRAEELGVKVKVFEAGTDVELQLEQAENLILQGVDVLVVVPQDAEKSALIVDKAHQEGIKVIAYDRLIKSASLDYYVSFDSVKVGASEAQGVLDVVSKGKFAYVGGSKTDTNAFLVKEGAFKVLQPLIDSGDIEIVYNEFTDDWKQEIAYANLKNFLSNGGQVDAVIAANDGTAAGVIRALEERGLAGKIPVSGQDASLAAVQFVANGKQTITVYKPIKNLAYKAAEMAVAIARGENVETNNTIQNGTVLTPAYLLDVVSVTKSTIDETVIKDGFHTRDEVYGK